MSTPRESLDVPMARRLSDHSLVSGFSQLTGAASQRGRSRELATPRGGLLDPRSTLQRVQAELRGHSFAPRTGTSLSARRPKTPLETIRNPPAVYLRSITMIPPEKRKLHHVEAIYNAVSRKMNLMLGLDEKSLREMSRYLHYRRHETNETLFRQGDEGLEFFIIWSGSVRISVVKTIDGAERIVRTLYAGQSFGELALLKDSTRNATVACRETSEFFVLKKEDYDRIMKALHLSHLQDKERVLLNAVGFHKEVLALEPYLVRRIFEPHKVMVRQETAADGIYFIVSGTCSVVKEMVMQKKEKIGELAPISPRFAELSQPKSRLSVPVHLSPRIRTEPVLKDLRYRNGLQAARGQASLPTLPRSDFLSPLPERMKAMSVSPTPDRRTIITVSPAFSEDEFYNPTPGGHIAAGSQQMNVMPQMERPSPLGAMNRLSPNPGRRSRMKGNTNVIDPFAGADILQGSHFVPEMDRKDVKTEALPATSPFERRAFSITTLGVGQMFGYQSAVGGELSEWTIITDTMVEVYFLSTRDAKQCITPKLAEMFRAAAENFYHEKDVRPAIEHFDHWERYKWGLRTETMLDSKVSKMQAIDLLARGSTAIPVTIPASAIAMNTAGHSPRPIIAGPLITGADIPTAPPSRESPYSPRIRATMSLQLPMIRKLVDSR